MGSRHLQSPVAVRERSPLSLFDHTFTTFSRAAAPHVAREDWYCDADATERVYACAQEALEGTDLTIGTVPYTLLHRKSAPQDGTGLYLSALHNKNGGTAILDGLRETGHLGYRLDPEATLLLCPGLDTYSIGEHGEGTILSAAKGEHLAHYQRDGVQIGTKGSEIEQLGTNATGGLALVLNDGTGSIGADATGGVQIATDGMGRTVRINGHAYHSRYGFPVVWASVLPGMKRRHFLGPRKRYVDELEKQANALSYRDPDPEHFDALRAARDRLLGRA